MWKKTTSHGNCVGKLIKIIKLYLVTVDTAVWKKRSYTYHTVIESYIFRTVCERLVICFIVEGLVTAQHHFHH